MYASLNDLPALQQRTRAATNRTSLNALSNLDDPFRVMEADQAQQSGTSDWAPFYQALNESGNGKPVRVAGIGQRASMRGLDAQQFAPYYLQEARLQGLKG